MTNPVNEEVNYCLFFRQWIKTTTSLCPHSALFSHSFQSSVDLIVDGKSLHIACIQIAKFTITLAHVAGVWRGGCGGSDKNTVDYPPPLINPSPLYACNAGYYYVRLPLDGEMGL